MNKVITLITILACICTVSVTHVSAKAKDKITPAEESVCDELVDGTPGLFGLCVAYCEAQDCGDPLVDCGTSGAKILENYNKKKGPGDPDMPCLAVAEPAVACPCFSEADILEMSTPFNLCFVNYRDILTAISSDGIYLRVIHDANPKCYNGFMAETTPEENSVCRSMLTTAINTYGCVTSW